MTNCRQYKKKVGHTNLNIIYHLDNINILDYEELLPEQYSSSDTENAEFYFSCHERMIDDKSKKQNKNNKANSFYTESSQGNLVHREIQSMPNLTHTTLNDEIEYELINYKINESSKADESSPSCAENPRPASKFVSLRVSKF